MRDYYVQFAYTGSRLLCCNHTSCLVHKSVIRKNRTYRCNILVINILHSFLDENILISNRIGRRARSHLLMILSSHHHAHSLTCSFLLPPLVPLLDRCHRHEDDGTGQTLIYIVVLMIILCVTRMMTTTVCITFTMIAIGLLLLPPPPPPPSLVPPRRANTLLLLLL